MAVVRVISFPFRLDGTGSVASVPQDSDQYMEEQIALALLTRPGERIQVPTFGTADPAFARFQVSALQRHLLDFGPEIDVKSVAVDRTVEGQERVVVDWQRSERNVRANAATQYGGVA